LKQHILTHANKHGGKAAIRKVTPTTPPYNTFERTNCISQ